MCQLRFEMQTLLENIRWSDKEDSKQSDVKTLSSEATWTEDQPPGIKW